MKDLQNLTKYTLLRPGDELFPGGPRVLRKCSNGDVYVIAPQSFGMPKLTKKMPPEWDVYLNSLPNQQENWFIPSSEDIGKIFNSTRALREFLESEYDWDVDWTFLLSDPVFKRGSGKYRKLWRLNYVEDVGFGQEYRRVETLIILNTPFRIKEEMLPCNKPVFVLPIQLIKFNNLHQYMP